MASGGQSAAAAAQIKAPMPGRVVRVLVAVGDTVDKGTPLLIIEAMKMENEMHAAAAGVVAQISVSEGDTVDPGQLLCLLELPETAAAE
ncbi:MAG TPA: acetyl-CoA carboxylase biotin carboxyl carrier protein subunit, partial [Nannocystis exedens]|nr:acetyl-CoA carboxylase biotin carboxyl carrier protein subunit [Nannocystis exedens]